MSIVFDLDPKGRRALEEEARLNPLHFSQVEASTFMGVPKGIGMSFMKGGAGLAQFAGLGGAVVPMAIDKIAGGDNLTGKTLTERYFEAFDSTVSNAVDYWTPSASEVGVVGRILGGLAELVLPLMAGGGKPIPLIGSQQMGISADLVRKNVDADTAAKAGLLQGGATAIGFRLPAAFGSTLAQRLATGAGVNAAIGLPQRSATSALLEEAGHADLAKAYGNSPEAVTLDVLTGLVFGGIAHAAATRLKPSDVDTVLAANNAKHFQHDTAPGTPADAKSSAAHQAAMETAVAQLLRGEKVNVADSIHEAEFVRPPTPKESPIAAAIREAYPDITAPRGIRNNNPGNIERGPRKWQGEIIGDDPRFATFETPEAGIRALAKNLLTYHEKHGLNTVDGIIGRWAPANENATAAYAAAVAKELGVGVGDQLDLRNPDTLSKLTTAIIRYENGQQPYKPETIRAGVDAALIGAPAQALSAKQFPIHGNEATVFTERGVAISTRYVVVEAPSLVTSHDNTLRPNPAYPSELQPRDRERAASEAQIARIENDINPELLAESPRASDGAPIIGTDMVVESGNARTIALRRAYETGKADAYRQWLNDNAERFGLDPAQVAAMKRPVLARVGLGEYDRAEFARQANESSVAQMSVTETARADAARMPDLMGLVTNEDGTINIAQSLPFIRAYIANVVSPTERGMMMAADGAPSQQGLQRIRNAVFAKAYGDPEIVAMMAESIDANVKNVLAGMLRAAPGVARLKDLIEAGARHPVDITGDLVHAVRQFSKIRAEGMTVDQFLAQQSLFDSGITPEVNNLLIGLQENARAPKRIAEMIGRIVDAVDQLGDPRQHGMFDSLPKPKAQDLIADAVETLRAQNEVKQSGDLFKSPEFEAARQVVEQSPDMRVRLDDGTEVSAREALERARDDMKQAEADVKAFDAAVNCFLRTIT